MTKKPIQLTSATADIVKKRVIARLTNLLEPEDIAAISSNSETKNRKSRSSRPSDVRKQPDGDLIRNSSR